MVHRAFYEQRQDYDMTKFIFKGPAANLGRFGAVAPGDVLLCTEHEAGTIATDERFEPWTEKAEAKARDAVAQRLKAALDGAKTPAEKEAAKAAIEAEKTRRDLLSRANADESVALQELRSLTRPELVDRCSLIRETNPSFRFDASADQDTLFRLLTHYYRTIARNPPIGVTRDVESDEE